MRIIAYGRVSSREQSENSHALEQQIARLQAAGATEIITDVESGSKNDRKGFEKLMRVVRSRDCDQVIITRIDRLSRSIITLRKAIDQFKESGVTLLALDDSVDTATAGGKFHLNMLGCLAEMEVDRLSERVKHGWQHLRDCAVAVQPPFGYEKVDDHFELDHHPFLSLLDGTVMSKAALAEDIIEAFFRQRSLRLCLREINQKYGLFTSAHHNEFGQHGGVHSRGMFRFSPSGLRNWLVNPVLNGHITYLKKRGGKAQDPKDWDIRYNSHDAFVTEEQRLQILEILETNRSRGGWGTSANQYPLSGRVFCGECQGAHYSCQSDSRRKSGTVRLHYYQCKNWATRGCSQNQTIRHEIVEEAAIAALVSQAHAINKIAQLPLEQSEPLELRELRSQLSGLNKLGYNQAIESAKNQLRAQITNWEHNLEVEDVSEHSKHSLLEIFSNPMVFETMPVDDRQRIYRALIDRIVIINGFVEVVRLFNGAEYRPVKLLKCPAKLLGVRLSVGDNVTVCWDTGDTAIAKIIEQFGYHQRRKFVLDNGLTFDRITGKQYVDGRTVENAKIWITK
jgi:site-specific DNA recombinase